MRHPNVADCFPFGESKTKGRRARFPKFTTTSRGLQSLDDDRHEKRNVKYYGCLERGHSPRSRLRTLQIPRGSEMPCVCTLGLPLRRTSARFPRIFPTGRDVQMKDTKRGAAITVMTNIHMHMT
ncbi:hypothetical protein IscW_ISCW000438 [Ixodes scapularis]|uniref:Uncharacterized protein n=1 Tax=Ixodes scapularis TaxID=6945 RepID=B7P3K8_IXOSC|nr:hypothetical protein IscW_ISCW000438 [Ixodes scapularis]|eukprot:XP_002404341.1 hypothetical protein IscW_ISCW000438 [Ixodes scapularis]